MRATSGLFWAMVVGFAVWTTMTADAPAQRVVPLALEPLSTIKDVPPPQTISVPLNKVHLVDLPEPVRDIVVANPEIVDAIVRTPQQVYLVARGLGTTNLFFVGHDGDVV